MSSINNSGSSKRAKKRSVFPAIGYGIFLFAAIAIGTTVGWLQTSRVVRKVGLLGLIHPPSPQQEFPGKSSLTVLILGCDENRSVGGAKVTTDAARSDTMLLVKLDFANNEVTGVNIPRDTLCELPGYRDQKINAYHALGGNQLAAKAVEYLLPGVHIDRTVTINYGGFVNMINAVDGVYVDVPRNMNYDDNAGHLHIHLKEGPQWLTGQTALDFARFRHADSDIKRQERQHLLVYAMKDRVIHRPQSLTSVLDGVAEMFQDGFNDQEIVSIGEWIKDVPSNSISFGVLPTKDAPRYNLALVRNEVPMVLQKYHLLSE